MRFHRHQAASRRVAGALLLVALIVGCGDGVTPETATTVAATEMVDEGSWYARVQWPHDGRPYESENFIVYSDSASKQARREVAEIAEGILADLLNQFDVRTTDFRFPEGQQKSHIYAYHDYNPQTWGGRAYYPGLVMWSTDHEERNTDRGPYSRVVRHEMTHLVQNLLLGREPFVGTRVDMWFGEGLAEFTSGGTSGGAITNLSYLNELTDQYGHINPIAIHLEPQYQDPVAYWEYHYPIFQLAVEYLVDESGLGRSLGDVSDMFLDMAEISEGVLFATVFEDRMGISLADYEEQFFKLMAEYLPAGGSPSIPMVPIGLALLLGAAIFTAWRLRLRRASQIDR